MKALAAGKPCHAVHTSTFVKDKGLPFSARHFRVPLTLTSKKY